MEVLNYSLWFTLVWWVFILYALISRKTKPTVKGLFITMIIIPMPAILLEYLIMR